MEEHHLYTNRLIHEKSPYLLQHSHNPVDWYAWGQEAFDEARSKDKPIFLSIGYATCHWCHTMEKESFEDPEIAKEMNETFVNIKLDREELPEVDSLYMEFAQSMMAGAAGWPLNVILTPNLNPFFAVTYLPPFSRHGLMGLTDLIARIREMWQGAEKEQVSQQAAKIVEVFAKSVHTQGDAISPREQIEDAAELLFKLADPLFGGMKGAPKFPIGYQDCFMLRYSSLMQDSRALFLVEKTLDMMQRGGIYDHLGGGFSRYSVDERWLVPHFEKMLYDNAILAGCYLEAWQMTKKPFHRKTCSSILDYVLREMTHAEGGFFSAEDADSEGREGWYYTWDLEEVQALLGKKESQLFCEFYGITNEGNFDNHRNILHTPQRLGEFAEKRGLEIEKLESQLSDQRDILMKARDRREHPFKDDKILSSWNGLMIGAMAQAGCAFNDRRYLDAAVRAATFIKVQMWQEGQLFRRWRGGETLYPAGLDEYAFMIRGVLCLFEAGCGIEWLVWAFQMSQNLELQFKVENGAYYQTDGQDPNLIIRKCQFADAAEPSGNAVHCENLLRLHQLTQEDRYFTSAQDVLKAAKKYIDVYPPGYCYQLINLLHLYDSHSPTLIISLNHDEEHEGVLHEAIFSNFIPHKAVIWKRQNDMQFTELLPITMEHPPIDGRTTLYICYKGRCEPPITALSDMISAIQKL